MSKEEAAQRAAAESLEKSAAELKKRLAKVDLNIPFDAVEFGKMLLANIDAEAALPKDGSRSPEFETAQQVIRAITTALAEIKGLSAVAVGSALNYYLLTMKELVRAEVQKRFMDAGINTEIKFNDRKDNPGDIGRNPVIEGESKEVGEPDRAPQEGSNDPGTGAGETGDGTGTDGGKGDA